MTTVSDILTYLETLAPLDLAMDWDNPGLQLGDRSCSVTRVLVALDPFEDVAREAISYGAELVVTHHPLFFSPIKSLTEDTAVGRTARLLIQNNPYFFALICLQKCPVKHRPQIFPFHFP